LFPQLQKRFPEFTNHVEQVRDYFIQLVKWQQDAETKHDMYMDQENDKVIGSD